VHRKLRSSYEEKQEKGEFYSVIAHNHCCCRLCYHRHSHCYGRHQLYLEMQLTK